MLNSFNLTRKHQIILSLVIAAIFLTLASGSALTNRPQIDEGMFASPALNLARDGFFGTTVLETEDSSLTRIEERTYWVMPLFLLNAAASFKILGFGLFTMRLVSILMGLILIIAGYLIALKLSENKNIALLGAALLACDYMVLDTASQARPDMMCAALGLSAIAAFLVWREKNFSLAVLLSQTLVVLAGLTHPNGILAFFALAFLTLYFDFRQIKLKHLGIALIPYLIGGTAFGLYILQDPQAFKDQFIDNALMGGRMSGFSSPFSGFIREFTERYPHAFGLQANSGGHSGPIFLKSLILIGYALGVLGVLFTKELRQNRNYRALLVLTAIYFVWMALMDGQKQTYYIIQIVPFYLIMLAIWINWLWRRNFLPRSLIALGLSGLLLLGIGGMSLRIKQNTYGNFYNPMIAFLKQNSTENDLIMGGAELGFGLGFPKNHIADGRFGLNTGKRPKFIMYDSAVENSFADSKIHFPEFYEYFPRLLKEEYRVAYENDAFKIYERRK